MLMSHPDDGIVLPVQAIIFDLDGTLIEHDEDYKRACVVSVARCSNRWGWKKFRRNDFEPEGLPEELGLVYEWGLHSRHVFRNMPKPVAKILDQARYEMSLDYIKPDKALRESLLQAKESGIDIFVMTHSEEEIAFRSLEKADLSGVFEKRHVNTVYGKSSVETFFEYLDHKLSDVSPERIVFFDDTSDNVFAAERAGLTSILFESGDEESLAKMVNDVVFYNEGCAFEAQFDILCGPSEP